MTDSTNSQMKEKKTASPKKNPYTIDTQSSVNSESNKYTIIEEKDGIRAIGGA